MNIEDNMNTLSQCVTHAVKEGFIYNMSITDNTHLCFQKDGKIYIFRPEAIAIKSFYRFEGASDPADNAILYLVETEHNHKGTLVDGYGPTANPKVGEFMKQVEDFQKQKMKDIE